MRKPSRTRITDVSAAAGVSNATVSRVLNGAGSVDPALAARVLDVVRDLGYRPNAAAQGLVRGETGTIGVLVPDLANPYFPDVLKSISSVASAHGRRVMIMESNEDPTAEYDLAEDLMRCCDGILLCSPRMDRAELVELAARGHKMVLVNRIVPGLDLPSVTVDFFGGMLQICGHLAQLGHRRVSFLSGPEASWANGERIRACSAAEQFGLRITVAPCGFTSRDGYQAAPAVLDTDSTAIITYNDLVALGALTRLRELDVAVPRQLSIVGFDDIAPDHSAHPILTTVSVPRDRLGREAADLLERALTADHNSEPVHLPMHLLVRETSAPPADGPAPGRGGGSEG